MVVTTLPMREGAELVGENGFRYLLVRAFGQPNVWLAVDAATQEKIFIVKQPSADDLPGWPHFQHEMVMHELFKENPVIRQQVDRIRPTSSNDPPRLVLELLQTTLWDARRKREFSNVEIKEIMRSALLGLQDVHSKDMVYADLKMQNILIDGFEQSEPNKHDTIQNNNITAKLGDLGIVMSPMRGLVQPIAYRAPEVYFRREISPAIDIWAWGLIYCQLLEAQASFHKFGMYDDILIQGPFWMKENHVQKSINNDFDLGGYDYYSGTKLPHRDREQREGQHWEHLKNKGVAEQEIAFLKWVLNPVPTERPTAQEILNCGWLTPDTADGIATRTFQSPRAKNARKNSEPILHARKRSEPSLFTRFYTQATNQLSKKPREATDPDPEEQAAKKPRQSLETHQQGMSVNESILAGGPPVLDTQAASIAREEKQVSRPATPRSSTQRPGTFLNYGAFMR